MKKIGVLVVTRDQYHITLDFVNKFFALFKKEYIHLLILDNNSQDSTYEKLHLRFPNLDIRKLNDNYGCVTGRNIGIVVLINMGCDYIFIVDNDVEIEDPEFFSKMLLFMGNNDEIDGCCPVVRRGKERTIQTLGARFNKLGIGKNVTDVSSDNRVDILPGAATFMRISAYKEFGLYDNDLSPISMEDYEWGVRARKKRAKLCYNPDTEVIHHHDRLKKDPKDKKASVTAGRVVFIKKHFTLFNLMKGIKSALQTAPSYGILFTIKSHINGFLKKTHRANFNYVKFSCQGVSKYYAEH